MKKKKIHKLVTGIEVIKDMFDDRLSLMEGNELYWGEVTEDYQLSYYDDLLCAMDIIESTGINLIDQLDKLLEQKDRDEKRLKMKKEIKRQNENRTD